MSIAEEYVFQVPIEGANISVIQPGMAEQIVNYAPIVHTIPAGQTETIVQNVDPTTPLYIVTPATTPVTIQIPANQNPIPSHVIEIPMQPNQHEVSEFIFVEYSDWLFFISSNDTQNRVNAYIALLFELTLWFTQMILSAGRI